MARAIITNIFLIYQLCFYCSTSHSASMRSGSAGGDPMGSTDTMTPSEVSTNVTLDTVSSHSGSQPASCRAICGSLASFDTSSILNTEGEFKNRVNILS